jgi:CRP-like cAMP-binding protein
MNTDQSGTPVKNQLLAALSAESYSRLLPHLVPLSFQVGNILYQPQQLIEWVYFPHQSVISLVNILEDGSQVEIGMVGGEGMIGTPVILANDTSPYQAMVQVANGAQRISAKILRAQLELDSELNKLLLRYTQALITQVSQTATCNRYHTIEERLARWLLQVHDRIKRDYLDLTQEFLSVMLGSRRAGVNVAAGVLQRAGLITYKRGHIEVLDREGLEEASCECYEAVRKEYVRLVGGI